MSQPKEGSRKSCRVLIKEICKKNKEKIEKLLLGGANVNGADYDGNTPLHHAMASGDINIVRLIIKHDGDFHAANNSGIRPYDVALNDNFVEAMELLLKKDAVITDVHKSVTRLPRHIVDLMYDRFGFRARNAEGHTALHMATINNDACAVRHLLARGADTTVTTTYKEETALHLVVSREIAEILLDHGASLNTLDRFAATPLSAVAMRNPRKLTRDEQSRIIELFLDRGAGVLEVLVNGALHLDYNGGFEAMLGLKDVLKFMGLREDEGQSFAKRISRGEFRWFYGQVLAEVAKMKEATLYCNVSFYEFLCKSWQRRTSRIDDVRLVNAVVDEANDDLAERFPLYCTILRRHIDAAIERNELRQMAATALTLACPELEPLPTVVDKVLMFFESKDMELIVEACNMSRK